MVRPPGMEGGCEYIEQSVADSRQRVVPHLWVSARGWQLVTLKNQLVTKCYTASKLNGFFGET